MRFFPKIRDNFFGIPCAFRSIDSSNLVSSLLPSRASVSLSFLLYIF